MEEWRKIPGLPDIYEASSLGRIRRLSYKYKTFVFGQSVDRLLPSKVYEVKKLNKKGYARIRLDGVTYLAHRLIAISFIPNPENLPQINHKNGIKTDNRISNLEWVTNKQNRDHAVLNKLQARGIQLSDKFTETEIKSIRFLCARGIKQTIVAQLFNTDQRLVSQIYLRRTWTHI